MLVNFTNGFIYASNKNVFILSVITCIVLISGGVIELINYPKVLSKNANFEGVLVDFDSINCAIVVKGEKLGYKYKYKAQETYEFFKDDLPNIREFIANNKSESINARIWSKKWQARQIELNDVMVKEYNWWKYAQPAFWLMILPGTVFLLLLILDRKRLLKEPEQTKNK